MLDAAPALGRRSNSVRVGLADALGLTLPARLTTALTEAEARRLLGRLGCALLYPAPYAAAWAAVAVAPRGVEPRLDMRLDTRLEPRLDPRLPIVASGMSA